MPAAIDTAKWETGHHKADKIRRLSRQIVKITAGTVDGGLMIDVIVRVDGEVESDNRNYRS